MTSRASGDLMGSDSTNDMITAFALGEQDFNADLLIDTPELGPESALSAPAVSHNEPPGSADATATRDESANPTTQPTQLIALEQSSQMLSMSLNAPPSEVQLVNTAGRGCSITSAAHLQGNFFGPEISRPSQERLLTCYRRSLFQVSGTLICTTDLFGAVCPAATGTRKILRLQASLTATKTTNNDPIKLVIIPPKQQAAAEAGRAPTCPDPPTIQISLKDALVQENGQYSTYNFSWQRIQFRVSTEKRGRKKEGRVEEYFVLHCSLSAVLSDGDIVLLSRLSSLPIAVRGRSPVNFVAPKRVSTGNQVGQANNNTQSGQDLQPTPVAGQHIEPIATDHGDEDSPAGNQELSAPGDIPAFSSYDDLDPYLLSLDPRPATHSLGSYAQTGVADTRPDNYPVFFLSDDFTNSPSQDQQYENLHRCVRYEGQQQQQMLPFTSFFNNRLDLAISWPLDMDGDSAGSPKQPVSISLPVLTPENGVSDQPQYEYIPLDLEDRKPAVRAVFLPLQITRPRGRIWGSEVFGGNDGKVSN
ncbi:hypothetical protein NQ176_g1636 [Zarea fungicola]|uniref:Uncharacterized protein n=1 Tax=Zarea fungicola TaxID=93591 RepID=A0ACC1NT12_9HYPO|nr:hypothetical protein NQ176_g1636 [Lecanicillium fungicola]